MKVNDRIEISLIEAENQGLPKADAIEYAARANNVTPEQATSVYTNLVELQDRLATSLGISI